MALLAGSPERTGKYHVVLEVSSRHNVLLGTAVLPALAAPFLGIAFAQMSEECCSGSGLRMRVLLVAAAVPYDVLGQGGHADGDVRLVALGSPLKSGRSLHRLMELDSTAAMPACTVHSSLGLRVRGHAAVPAGGTCILNSTPVSAARRSDLGWS